MSNFKTSDFMNTMRTQTWSNGRHLVRCVKVIPETHDVMTFTFSMNEPVLFYFKPGQFVTLELDIAEERIMRSYTISSSPSIPYSFSITVKRVAGGVVSNWLHDNLKSGDQIAVHGPVGNFNCMDFPAEKVLLLSGGVGITPVMSMARWWFNTDSEVDMVFAHSARSPKDIIYAKELEYMSTRIDNFKMHLICEQTNIGQSWGGYRGYLNTHMLQLMAPDLAEREVFCCGPELYMKAVRSMLQELGFDMSRYHEESFGETPEKNVELAEKHAEEAALEDKVPKNLVTLRIPEMDIMKPVELNGILNEAAAGVGVNIPKACGVGICGSCRVKVVHGQYEMDHNGGISQEEIDLGYVLSCCTRIKGDIEVEL
ncbi:hybrid-cluster NAD(P)-dependent oxidoreductase [Marinomonas sp. 5E14-1]|uniref:hybrid-cluster NAD(P)-dependent oxidoreductase n=1 Tax=Marinomonas sp. 5E14-1 TaxID=3153922 RepID=UPI003263BDA9